MSKPYREYTEQDIYNLKKENEELKIQIKTYAKVNEEDTKEWLKCKKCLDEIEDLLTTCNNNFGKSCAECKYTNQCIDIDTDTWILQKIKEVKGND